MLSRRCKGLAVGLLVAAPIALLMLVSLAGVAAASNAGLSNPVVDPRQLDQGGTVSVSVTYSDSSGMAPLAIAAQIGTRSVAMTTQSDSYATGVRYSANMVMSVAGVLQVSFRATDAEGVKHIQWSGFVHVDGASAAPPATSAPAASPTPIVGGGGSGGQSTGGDSGDSGPAPTPVSGGAATPAPATTPDPGAPTQPPTGGQPSPAGVLPPRTSTGGSGGQPIAPAASPVVVANSDTSAVNSAGGSSGKTGTGVDQGSVVVPPTPLDLLEEARHASLPTLIDELRPTIVTLATGTGAWAAFVLFGKRRRDDDQPSSDPALAAAAATSFETSAAPGLEVADESQLPRWRRPSLQQVRKADPLRAVATESSVLSFDRAGVRPLESYERRRIRYRLVRLLDSPDEVRATEIGVLDRDDEVQLLQRYGVYWQVLCPDGRTGWLHRMTLSDPDWDTTPQLQLQVVPRAPDSFEVEPDPISIESEDAEPPSDGLLEAYMRARSETAPMAPDAAPEVDWLAVRPAIPMEAGEDGIQPDPEPFEAGPALVAFPAFEPVEPDAGAVPAERWEDEAVLRAVDYLERAGFAVHGPGETLGHSPVDGLSEGPDSEAAGF